jgi:hypothetical protein
LVVAKQDKSPTLPIFKDVSNTCTYFIDFVIENRWSLVAPKQQQQKKKEITEGIGIGGAAQLTMHASGRGRSMEQPQRGSTSGTFSAAAVDEVWSEIVPGPLRYPSSLRLRLSVVIRDRRIGGEDVTTY